MDKKTLIKIIDLIFDSDLRLSESVFDAMRRLEARIERLEAQLDITHSSSGE